MQLAVQSLPGKTGEQAEIFIRSLLMPPELHNGQLMAYRFVIQEILRKNRNWLLEPLAEPSLYGQIQETVFSRIFMHGVPVANEGNAQFAAQLLTDGANGAIIAWTDLRTTLDYDIYSSKLFANGTLPLSLLSFDAAAANGNVKLIWNTENEINTSHFDVEFSADGITFKKLATVKATNLPGKNKYYFVHTGITDNVLFYRLKQFDLDGKTTYSKTEKINISKATQVTVYPNPAADFIRLKNIDMAVVAQVQFINSDGRLLLTAKANNLMQFNISHLKPGSYLLKIIKKDNSTDVIQFLK